MLDLTAQNELLDRIAGLDAAKKNLDRQIKRVIRFSFYGAVLSGYSIGFGAALFVAGIFSWMARSPRAELYTFVGAFFVTSGGTFLFLLTQTIGTYLGRLTAKEK